MNIKLEVSKEIHQRLLFLYELAGKPAGVSFVEYCSDVLAVGVDGVESMYVHKSDAAEACPFTPDPPKGVHRA